MKVTPQANGKVERCQTATYFESSGGLLLNATSIITGTSKDTEEDLKTARRLKNNPSVKKYEVQDDEEEHSVEYCPSIWFKPNQENSSQSLFGFITWKLCFLCFCLPLCYPCYLSRQLKSGKLDRKRKNSIAKPLIHEIKRGKQVENGEKRQKIKILFIQSKSSTKLLQEINREQSTRITTILEIMKEKKNQIACGVENDINKDTFNNPPDEIIKKKKRFKKISGNLMFLNLFSKKTPILEISDEEMYEDGKSPSYYSARSSNSGVFFTARNSVCDSAEEREETISFYPQVPSFTFTPPSTTRNPKSIWKKVVQASQISVSECLGQSQGVENKNNIFDDNKFQTGQDSEVAASQEPVSLKIETTFTVDSSYSLTLTDEGLMSDWDAENVHQVSSGMPSTTDILILVYEDDDELDNILNTTTGVMGYITKYWAGFFPLLLIQISSESNITSIPEGNSDQISKQFCSHHVMMHDWENQTTGLLECMVRYQVHLQKCGKSEKEKEKEDQMKKDWKCPGQCGLGNTVRENNQTEKRKRTFFQVVRKNITVRKVVDTS